MQRAGRRGRAARHFFIFSSVFLPPNEILFFKKHFFLHWHECDKENPPKKNTPLGRHLLLHLRKRSSAGAAAGGRWCWRRRALVLAPVLANAVGASGSGWGWRARRGRRMALPRLGRSESAWGSAEEAPGRPRLGECAGTAPPPRTQTRPHSPRDSCPSEASCPFTGGLVDRAPCGHGRLRSEAPLVAVGVGVGSGGGGEPCCDDRGDGDRKK